MMVYGIHPVREALKAEGRRIERIYVTRGRSSPALQQIIETARAQGVPLSFETAQVLERKAKTHRHQNVVAELGEVAYVEMAELLQDHPTLLLVADGVEDPRNLGALLRSAEGAGVEGVLLPERHSCGLSPTVVKASAGAAAHLKVTRLGNVPQGLVRLKESGYWIVGLDLRGRNTLREIDPTLPLVLVVGGEHRGLRRLVRERCDFLVSLPMKGRVASLNLSVAAAILLYRILEMREEAGLAGGQH